MVLARDLPRATEDSNRVLTMGMGTLTPLSACSAEFGVLSLLGFPASLGASGEGDTLIQWDLSLFSQQRHHFAQAIAILNTHGCNIFDHFSRKVMGLSGVCLVGVGDWLDREGADLGVGGMCAAGTMMPLPGPPQDYQRMLDLMRDIILATDLAHHLRIFKDLQKMAEGATPHCWGGVGGLARRYAHLNICHGYALSLAHFWLWCPSRQTQYGPLSFY